MVVASVSSGVFLFDKLKLAGSVWRDGIHGNKQTLVKLLLIAHTLTFWAPFFFPERMTIDLSFVSSCATFKLIARPSQDL
jgi:hypothetical protein